jgi:uncharacterized protein YaiE (UPF0345 family)
MPTTVTASFHADAVVVQQNATVRGVLQFPGDPVSLPVSQSIDGTGSIEIPAGAEYFGLSADDGTVRFATGGSGLTLDAGEGWPLYENGEAWRKVPDGHTHIAVREAT